MDEDAEFLGWSMGKDLINSFPFLPNSAIISTNLTLYEHVRYLHNRYIRDAAEYQVNISSSHYRVWADIIKNKDDCRIDHFKPQQIPALRSKNEEDEEVEMVTLEPQSTTESMKRKESVLRRKKNFVGVLKVLDLVEDTRKDLWKLMQDSYLRFRGTREYVAFVKSVAKKQQEQKAP
ncbi:hypothetical protein RFI_13039 [Reticulomyxa filosa]|uniref:Uncharacterized protein n=1 Tax=Reticulomyxa filosa TaxID=46433 RepID=X6LDJ3_RETFI|nr:hypothetical protein RFI_38275 [Reticulomyxa filosa]ETO24120.1 hypothetical protein RFI_13039 [Reticulomyxa filosa]|eukprot:ETN99206.1 hypothetical protein RFI_38275 [Reticulomyxa filosa]